MAKVFWDDITFITLKNKIYEKPFCTESVQP